MFKLVIPVLLLTFRECVGNRQFYTNIKVAEGVKSQRALKIGFCPLTGKIAPRDKLYPLFPESPWVKVLP